jgi:hypothetical protein
MPIDFIEEVFGKITDKIMTPVAQSGGSDGPRQKIGLPYNSNRDFTERVCFSTQDITICGWPSKGGVIIIDNATAPDFDYLGLDRLHPIMERHQDPDDEDALCEKMLLLGAKWWSSNARFSLLKGAELDDEDCIRRLDTPLEEDGEPEPELKERLWVRVAWLSNGGLVVSVFDTTLYGYDPHSDNFVPGDENRLRLCRDMNEKAIVLMEGFEGKAFASVEECQGDAFINLHNWREACKAGTVQE